MKLGEILGKSVDVIAKRPVILVPLLIVAIINVIATVAQIGWALSWSQYFGQFATQKWEAMRPEQAMQMWSQIFPGLAGAALVGFAVNVIIWVLAVIAFSMVIAMTVAALQEKQMGLSEAFSSISGKILLLIIVSLIVTVLKYGGICTVCIVTFIVWTFFSLARQGIVIDNLGFVDSLSKSFNVVRNNFLDVFLVLLLFFVVKILLMLIFLWLVPVLGVALGYIVDTFSVAALTVLYIDRKT